MQNCCTFGVVCTMQNCCTFGVVCNMQNCFPGLCATCRTAVQGCVQHAELVFGILCNSLKLYQVHKIKRCS